MSAEEWKNWPVIPRISENAIEIYRRGLSQGNNPQIFSIVGDCQSMPDVFMGVYDNDPHLVESLTPELRETITNFSGSFSRSSPTSQDGTTAAAVLWSAWHKGQFNCDKNESPLDCELRQHHPSIVLVMLGTHYETRNIEYVRKVLEKLIEHGSLPILATKADNREQDEHVNQQMAELALEYDIPLWNFYAATSTLPDNGVSVKAGREQQGEIYLVPEALEIHRFTALQVLDAVWRTVR